MTAYAVIARIERVDPHLAGRARERDGDWPISEPSEGGQAIDLAGQPVAPRLIERWTAIREAWAQTTVYLFDADGWR
jgi:hypothetical protein